MLSSPSIIGILEEVKMMHVTLLGIR
jgi:hypothetical protein